MKVDRQAGILLLELSFAGAVACLTGLAGAHATGQTPAPTAAVDRLVVSKSSHTLKLLSRGKAIRTYDVGLGRSDGAKQMQGDHKTPEGHYVIDAHNPHSSFYKALHISYPNAEDRLRARKAGVATGGDIMIHGLPPSAALLGPVQYRFNWTEGCVAVSNQAMDEIYRLVPNGTPIDITP